MSHTHADTGWIRVVVRGVPRKDIGGALVTFIIETSAGIVYDHAKEQVIGGNMSI